MRSIPNLYELICQARWHPQDPTTYTNIQIDFKILKVEPCINLESVSKWEDDCCPWVLFMVNDKYFVYETNQDSWGWHRDGCCEEDIKEISEEEALVLLGGDLSD